MVIMVITQKWCGGVEIKISTDVEIKLDGLEWFYGY